MAKKIIRFESELDRKHDYAIGFHLEGGGFTPIKSYSTKEELSRAYEEWYKLALHSQLIRPIAIQKLEKSVEWDGSQCTTLPEIMQKVIDENQSDRN